MRIFSSNKCMKLIYRHVIQGSYANFEFFFFYTLISYNKFRSVVVSAFQSVFYVKIY